MHIQVGKLDDVTGRWKICPGVTLIGYLSEIAAIRLCPLQPIFTDYDMINMCNTHGQPNTMLQMIHTRIKTDIKIHCQNTPAYRVCCKSNRVEEITMSQALEVLFCKIQRNSSLLRVICLPGTIWQSLQTFLVVIVEKESVWQGNLLSSSVKGPRMLLVTTQCRGSLLSIKEFI